MRIIADLHIHSKYSRACAKDLDLEHINQWAKIKGIGIVACADWTHPAWLKELKEKLVEAVPGLYQLKDDKDSVFFMLNTEISCIYTQGGKCRRIHLCIFVPDFETIDKIIAELEKRGVNLKADGRPIMGLSAMEITKIVLAANPDSLVVPAHAWTPWFSVFGSYSGFDSLNECFGNQTKYIGAIETGLSCYDVKTEVLTDNGWKKFSSINYADKICTLNSKNNGIEFQKPIKLFTYKHQGKMYKLKTRRVDLFVTPNHKLFYSPCDFRKPADFSLKEAEFLFNKSKRFKKDGIWQGENKKFFILPAVKVRHGSRYYSGFRKKGEKQFPIKPWLKFFGFWLAEGWTNRGKDGDYNVCLANRNKRLLFEMKIILQGFGYDVYHHEKSNIIRVRDYQLFYYLEQFGKSSDKFILTEIKSLSKELLKILFDYYIKGDGHIYGRSGKGMSATTSSISLRDDLQEIALKIGISAYYKKGRNKGTSIPSLSYKGKIYKQNEDAWVVYFIRRNQPIILPSMIRKYNYTESWVNFKGSVFCVTVPNHIIYIRRNGIPLWCGNSDPAMNWRLSALDKITLISNSDAHSPANLGREANVFEIPENELSFAEICRVIKEKDKKRFLYTIEFFPEEGKYHWDGHAACKIQFSPAQTKKNNGLCPVCKKPLTVGVLNRVEKLADRSENARPDAIGYKRLVPLAEIMAEVFEQGKNTKKVTAAYFDLIKKGGSEFAILLDLPLAEIEKITLPEVAQGIKNVREGKVEISAGYDGIYGVVKVFKAGERKKAAQGKLF